MKKLFIITIITFVCLCVNATIQFKEHIKYNNKDYSLLNLPLQDLPEYIQLSSRFPNTWNTGLGRNYIGYWKILKDSLYLDSITALQPADSNISIFKRKMSAVEMDDLMHIYKTNHGYFASWVNGTYYIADKHNDNILFIGVDCIYKHEIAINVVNGKIVSTENIYNKQVAGCKEREEVKSILSTFPTEKLSFAKPGRIVFQGCISKFKADGQPEEIQIKVCRTNPRQEFSESETKYIEKVISDFYMIHDIIPAYLVRGRYLTFWDTAVITIP